MRNSIVSKLTLFTALIFTSISYSQNDLISEYVDHYSNVVPETPNASTFTKYGGTTLNLSKGQPNISIPIYNLVVDGVSLPISISYDASGIRTDELATAVGLKWRLNAGGGVFRSINNEADENGWLSTNWSSRDNQWYLNNPISLYTTQNYLKNSLIDHSPDNFSYSISNYSGSFIFKRQDINTLLKNKNENFKLTPTQNVQTIISFTGKDIDGNTYYFGTNSKEFNSNTVIVGADTSINNSNESYVSSWMIDQIVTKNGKTINFEYQSYDMDYTLLQQSEKVNELGKDFHESPTDFCGKSTSGQYDNGMSVFNNSKTSINSRPKNKLIRKIYTNVIEINFNYDTITTNAIWDLKLSSIEIVDKINNKSKTFHLTHEFNNGDQRLRLKEIKEVGGIVEKPPYKFTYNEDYPMPDKETFSKDFYGYYNGKTNSSQLPFTPEIYSHLPQILRENIADRRPSFEHLVSGNLIEIEYPTGGKTQFEYELNQEENTSVYADDDYEKGGFSLNIDANDLTPSAGDYYKYTYSFTIPDYPIDFWTGVATANIFGDSESNAVDTPGENICNDPNVPPGIDCSRYEIYDMDNNGIFVKQHLIGYQEITTLEPGNYQMIVFIRDSEVIHTPNLLVSIDFNWYNYTTDNNGYKVKAPHYAGGLRVRKTKDIDADNKIYNETIYEYSDLVGQQRSYNNFSESLANGEYVMSSNYIGHPKLFKSGYFYETVTSKQIGYDKNNFPYTIKTINTFEQDFANYSYESKPKGTFVYNEDDNLLTKTLYQYATYQTANYYNILGKLDYCYMEGANKYTGYNEPQNMSFIEYENRLEKEIQTQYFYNGTSLLGNSTTTKTFDYNTNELPKEVEVDSRLTEISNLDYYDVNNYTTSSNYDKKTYTYKYSSDFTSTYSNLVNNKNILSIPVKMEVESLNNAIPNSNIIDSKYCVYDLNTGGLIELYTYNKGQGTNNSSTSYIPSNYDLHSSFSTKSGKLYEMNKNHGIQTTYLWDATKTFLLATIANATFTEIATALSVTETQLEAFTFSNLPQINTLRTLLPQAQVTTFNYEPLYGVTRITDPRGNITYYEYDDLGRLYQALDLDNNILAEYNYHYKGQ